VARQYAKEEREEKKAWAEELAATRALIKQQRDAATSQKSRDTLNKGKRKTLQGASKKKIVSGVVLWVLEVSLTLHPRCPLLHPK
jgi:hypothetical protein